MDTESLETTKIGCKEQAKLEPKIVEIVSVEIKEIGKGNKVICMVKHPDKDEPIQISGAKLEVKGKLEYQGLWVNLDEDKLIRKNSALAKSMVFFGAGNIKELVGKSIMTTEDDGGYLVFKAY